MNQDSDMLLLALKKIEEEEVKSALLSIYQAGVRSGLELSQHKSKPPKDRLKGIFAVILIIALGLAGTTLP